MVYIEPRLDGNSIGHVLAYFADLNYMRDRVALYVAVTLIRVKSARVTAVWIGDHYMRWMKLFMSMAENILNNWYSLRYIIKSNF